MYRIPNFVIEITPLMKKILLSCIATIFLSGLYAQDVNIAGPSTYIKCSKFYITKAVRDLPIAKLKAKSEIREAADSVRRLRNAAKGC